MPILNSGFLKRFFAVAFFLLMTSGSVRAATYYVNVSTGDDTRSTTEAQSESTPWKTITHATTSTEAGDIIGVAAGRYGTDEGESFPIGLGSGRSLVKNGAGIVTIEAASSITDTITMESDSTIEGLTVKNSNGGWAQVDIFGGNNRVNGCTIEVTHYSTSYPPGILVRGPYNVISNNTVITAESSDGSSDGAYGMRILGSYCTIEANNINGGFGSLLNFNGSFGGINIKNNTMTNTKAVGDGIDFSGTNNSVSIEGNSIFVASSGYGIYSGNFGGPFSYYISRNKIVGSGPVGSAGINLSGVGNGSIVSNEVRGFDWGVNIDSSNSGNIMIDRNTMVGCRQVGIRDDGASSGAVTIKNNIIDSFSASGSVGIYKFSSGALATSYNDVFGNDNNWAGLSPGPGTGDISADPRFVDPAGNDFHLKYNSPCINSGDPTSAPDPDGSRADMGDYPFDLRVSGTMAAYVKSPNGGESLNGLSNFEVKWYATKEGAAFNHIELYYSTNGGSTYPYMITNEAANTGSYLWTVPNQATTQGKVRVKAVGPEVIDDSDSNFAIQPFGDCYVDVVSGSNGNNGQSPSSAWKNISYAAVSSAPGSTVHVAPGVYDAAAGESFPIHISGESFISTITGLATIEGAGGGYTLAPGNNTTLEGFAIINDGPNYDVFLDGVNNVALKNNFIVGSYMGVLALNNCSNMLIEGNKVVGNNGMLGVAASGGNGVVTGNEVRGWTDSSAGYGYGIGFLNGGVYTVNKNTIVQNLNGVGVFNGNAVIKNNIVASKVGGYSTSETTIGITTEGGTVASTYNDVYANDLNWSGISSGTGDISADAQFVGAANGDFHLQAASPCVDAGDPAAQYNDPDLSRADMGAYPYYHIPTTTTTTTSTSTTTAASTTTTTTTTTTTMPNKVGKVTLTPGAGATIYLNYQLKDNESTVIIQILDQSGTPVITPRTYSAGEAGTMSGQNLVQISAAGLPAGVYYYQIIIGGIEAEGKFLYPLEQ